MHPLLRIVFYFVGLIHLNSNLVKRASYKEALDFHESWKLISSLVGSILNAWAAYHYYSPHSHLWIIEFGWTRCNVDGDWHIGDIGHNSPLSLSPVCWPQQSCCLFWQLCKSLRSFNSISKKVIYIHSSREDRVDSYAL